MTNGGLIVHGSTMRAAAFAVHLSAITAAQIVASAVAIILTQGKSHIKHQQQIANEIKRRDAENDVFDGANSQQTTQIKQRLAYRQLVENVIDGCQTHYQHRPNRSQENRQQQGNVEWVERRMEIEMAPHLGREGLDARIKRGCRSHQERQQRGIKRIDVVEMNDMRILAQHPAHEIEKHD